MSPERRSIAFALALCLSLFVLDFAAIASAEPLVGTDSTPTLHAVSPAAQALYGRPIARIDVLTVGDLWAHDFAFHRVRVGDLLTPEVARRALRELADSGGFADVRAEVEAAGDGVVLRLFVTPRRIVASVRIVGGSLDREDSLQAAGVDAGSEVTAGTMAESTERLRAFYARRGFPNASVSIESLAVDDPLSGVLVFHVAPGRPRIVQRTRFVVAPRPTARASELISGYGVSKGDRADDDSLDRADRALKDALRQEEWPNAEVSHRVDVAGGITTLVVDVRSGPAQQIRFEGNRHIDQDELEDALGLADSDDRAPSTLASRITKYYVERGFLDAQVRPELRGSANDSENLLVLHVREGDVVRVMSRQYPCLTGERSASQVGEEIDSFLSEALPGAGLIGSVDPSRVDAALGPLGTTGARVAPMDVNPWRTYVADVYDRATRHLQELYRSEGYLAAVVGPAIVLRRACDRHSPAGKCIPIGARTRSLVHCPVFAEVPAAEVMPPKSCVPDPKHGVRCEPEIVLEIPVKLGPRTILWDASFEGNQVLVESELSKVAELEFGAYVSQVELEKARRRLLDEYTERGFAFATIEQRIELSPDRTRARARFIITEREQAHVKDIVVRGAEQTNESLILGRVALKKGGLYRRSDVRATEERISTLGVFSSVSVGLEDPEVFAKEKVVVVTVRERTSQYLDIRPGFSTGDGFRITFEYGHRNLGGHAIRLTLRTQLGYLPDFLIFDPVVRDNFDALSAQDRLERRDSISLEFPEIGLGPLFPLGFDLVDVRDNSRDFGLTKDALIVTQSYRPTTRFVAQIGGSFERNNAAIFAEGESLTDYLTAYLQQTGVANLRLLVPQGLTGVVAERASVTWDRRDNPFNAARGTFVSASAEHVHAEPLDETANIVSDFMRVTARVAGYVPLSPSGLALALSVRWGENFQLTRGSQTYPDRLFFLGGVDSLRGFLQDSVIPEDIAQQIIRDEKAGSSVKNPLTANDVPIRGGDLLVNPRAELRIPLGGIFQTALFLDTGNLWSNPRAVFNLWSSDPNAARDPFRLRYAAGTGLRANTPVGPLALDFGVNLDKREWEDPFAFHFSIGVF